MSSTDTNDALIEVESLTMAYGSRVVQSDLDFAIRRGDVFVIMGDSGCGKSTLLRHLIGLKRPAAGRVLYDGVDYWAADEQTRERIMRRSGVLYQSGALWTSMTLFENIALPLREYTDLDSADIREVVALKLALVGLAGFEASYPAEISGGQRKRASLARAMALDPEVLFCDEPSAGLDPLSACRLDELILNVRASFGTTVVVVTHELASIFAIATDSVFLDADSRTMIAAGAPADLLAQPPTPKVGAFLARGGKPDTAPNATDRSGGDGS